MTTDTCDRANVTFWHGERDGVLYRRQFFGYELETECHWIQAVNLSESGFVPVLFTVFRLSQPS